MKTIAIIKDVDVRPDYISPEDIDYESRTSPRAVLFDKDNKIALLHVTKHNYYKLPGGGVEEGEDIEKALIRECLEEAGCKIKIGSEIGQVVEYRSKWQKIQNSPCFLARVDGDKGKTSFEDDELDYGFKLVWVDFEEALALVKNSKPDDTAYDSKFIVKRDTAILEEAKKLINK